MMHSILFYKRHMRSSKSKLFSAPMFQTGFWDLRNGGDMTEEKFQTGQVRMNGPGEAQLCDELEELAESLMEESKDAQKKVMVEINRVRDTDSVLDKETLP